MKKLVLLVLSLFFISSLNAQTDKRLKGVEKEMNAILETAKAAGFAVAVVEGDKVIYAKGFGYSDYENKIPVDTNTLFAIGSSTKAFTSSVLGVLRAEDKLSFDDNPRQHLPELEFYNDDMNSNIIIKDLMRHSTGLPRHDMSWYNFTSHDKDSLITRVKYQKPFTGVRQQWYYNNFMFLAQGLIAERITGKSWEDNIRDLFIKPLGMTRTNVSIDEMKTASNAAFGYNLKDGEIIEKTDYYDIAAMSPAGSINSSVNDMSKWLITWINDGKYNGKEILPEAYVKEAMSSQMVIGAALPKEDLENIHFANYGYGWMLQSYKGHYRVDHGGNINGFSANVCFFPSDDIGIVVLTNQNGSAVTTLARNTISDRLLDVNTTDWVKKHADLIEKRKKASEESKNDKPESSKVENTKPSHVKQDYTGVYSNKGYGDFKVELKNDSLFSEYLKIKQYVKHYHYDTFEFIDVIDNVVDTSQIGNAFKIKFNTNATGDISSAEINVEPTLGPIVFDRTPLTINVNTDDLQRYVGEFDLKGTTIKTYIKNGDTLYLFVTGQPEYELLATDEHKFSFKAIDGFKVEFTPSDDGSINDMTLIQPNGTFKTKRKAE
ncbi:serine hydrolase [Ichthyenterobacterium magnum]|uniref:CubicO group peptidase (Beta-lactamase class C family) n=1 Tax=Ichthyenterobacterium magnum TaxID=1230530 RepID=A0A420DUU0_9FLAO|nr:serine hydrolase [Ichthyenterobacterium magnum]RKE97943.1 CubicO group peptidase (beta-lactamase class C family) [Ichthyenterobacterium magnum]